MPGESNQIKWCGIRPVNPPESIPIYFLPPEGYEYVNANGTANNEIVSFYTVPEGKTLYIFDILLALSAYTTQMMHFYIRDAADENPKYFMHFTGTIAAYSSSLSFLMGYKVPELYDLVLYTSAATANISVSITGYRTE